MHLPIAITMGDPAGIGPEIIAKAFRDAPERDARAASWRVTWPRMRRAAAWIARPGELPLPVAVIEHAVRGAGGAAAPAFRCCRWCAAGRSRSPSGGSVPRPVAWRPRAWCGRPMPRCAARWRPWSRRRCTRRRWPRRVRRMTPIPAIPRCCRHAQPLFGRSPLQEMPVRMMLANDELRTVLVSIHMSLARRHRRRDASATCCRPCRSPMRRCGLCWGARRASRWPASTRMPARAACSAARKSRPLRRPWRRRVPQGLDVHGPVSRPTPSSCARARGRARPGSSMWWSRCTTTRD